MIMIMMMEVMVMMIGDDHYALIILLLLTIIMSLTSYPRSIGEAYEILSDPQKKARYDEGQSLTRDYDDDYDDDNVGEASIFGTNLCAFEI